LVLVLSIYILEQAGKDITIIGNAAKYAGYVGIFWVFIIMFDKANMMWLKNKVRNLNQGRKGENN